MQHLLTLNVEIDKLNDKEFNQFITSFGRNDIKHILFQYFHLQLKQIDNIQQSSHIVSNIQKMNSKITKIIKARKENVANTSSTDPILTHNDNEVSTPINLDTLPNIMISEVSSYLDFESILDLEKVSKSIFIGTRSPLSLHSMGRETFLKCWKYSAEHQKIYNWLRFQSIKQLVIDVENMVDYEWIDHELKLIKTKYKLQDMISLQKLKVLKIQGIHDEIHDALFAELAKCNLSNVETFSLFMDNLTVSDQLIADMGLTNVEFMEMAYDNNAVNAGKRPNDSKYMNILKGLCLMDDSIHINNTLESFHQTRGCRIMIDEDVTVGLKEICLMEPSKEDIDVLVSDNVKCLERIHYTATDKSMLSVSYQQMIERLFKTATLNYISIDVVPGTIMIVLWALNRSFSRRMHKKTMKLRILCRNSRYDEDTIKEEICDDLSKLVDALNDNYTNFMLICHLDVDPKYDHSMDMLLNNQRKRFLIHSGKRAADKHINYKFVISNKNCTINGYHERWIMDCSECEHKPLFYH